MAVGVTAVEEGAVAAGAVDATAGMEVGVTAATEVVAEATAHGAVA
jgi:hypothetical protein